jgi:cellular nucleic acid-binding protein
MPNDFCKGDDVEAFIKDCEKYFQFAQMSNNRQEVMIEVMIDKEIRHIYTEVEENVKGYKERLRKAFTKKTSLSEDLRAAFGYRQSSEEPENYFDIVDRLVKKLLQHEWTAENLTEQLLVHCSAEKSLRKELCLTDTKGTEGVKQKIRKLHESRIVAEEIHTIRGSRPEQRTQRSYREVVTGNQGTVEPRRYNNFNESKGYREDRASNSSVVCWTCNKTGHFSRECTMKKTVTCYGCGVQGHVNRDCPNRQKKIVTCFACGIEGHVRRDCQKIKCRRCNLGGHKEEDCYTNLSRIGYRRNNENDNRQFGRYNNNRQENTRYQGTRNETRPNNNRYVACMDGRNYERNYERTEDEYREYPNANAPAQEEIVGAVC